MGRLHLKILIVEKNDIGIHAYVASFSFGTGQSLIGPADRSYAQSEPWWSLRMKYREAINEVKIGLISLPLDMTITDSPFSSRIRERVVFSSR